MILAFACVQVAIAQDKAQADRWHGLVLDQSTPDDAIKTFGQPKKDGPGYVYSSPIQNWLSRQYQYRGGKVFRNLEYDKPTDSTKKLILHFLNDKLVGINVYFSDKQGVPTKESLPIIYGIPFEPVIGERPFFQPGSDSTHHWAYPECGIGCLYGIVAVTEKSFVIGGMLGNRLLSVTLLSRTLQSKDGL